jgi:general secretion pathway protein E
VRPKIGQIFIEKHGLTPERLEEALASQRGKTGERIGEILVRLNYLSEETVIEAVAHQWDIPFLSAINPEKIDTKLAQSVPISFAKKYKMLPLRQIGRTVQIATSDPLNMAAIDDLRLLLKAPVQVIATPPAMVQRWINKIYEQMTDTTEQAISDLSEENLTSLSQQLPETADLLDTDDEAPIIRLMNSVLFEASKQRASDIHFEPFENEMTVRYRIDGMLYNILTVPKNFQSSLTSRIKIMAGMNIAEKRLPQDGRISIRIGGREVDIRVSDVPTAHGERLVLRLLDKTTLVLTLEDIGFSPEGLAIFSRLVTRTHGIILVTGPTGSGKSTTLYASLQKINSPEKNIITIEDPIEYQIKGVGQIQVNPKIDLTFANGLRSILRQDPDVIMVGEIRDVETAAIAIHASLTGHLVFSTLHTNDSAGAVTRLLDMGIEPFLVSSSVLAIVAQRLIRVLCQACKTPYDPTEDEAGKLGIKKTGSPFYRGKGCPACMNTGFHGRMGIYEILLVDDEVRGLVLAKVDANQIKAKAMSKGMLTLREEGVRKILEGMTTTEEVLRVTHDEI